ncbi:hypothetical protein [Stenotrophomonas maltophilia]|nr:hypothetical protein [Stenotrophomonas maltophilia]
MNLLLVGANLGWHEAAEAIANQGWHLPGNACRPTVGTYRIK